MSRNIILIRILILFRNQLNRDIGGILTLEFDEKGNLQFKTEALDADAMYDEIGSVLKIKSLQSEKRELLESLEMYYRVFFLGENLEEDVQNVDNGD